LLLCGTAACGEAWAVESIAEVLPPAQRVRERITAVRAETPPVIDGHLDEEVWSRAAVIRDLRQVEPVQGAAPSEDTLVRILYDEEALYLGIRSFDRDPGAMIRTALGRDSNQRGDARILIMLDPFQERRTGYMFSINPNGSLFDGLVEEGQGFRQEWDAIWFGESSIDEEGWIAEVAIPHKSLNFDPTKTSWGFNIERWIQRRNEAARWSSVDQNVFVFDPAHYGDLDGLEGLEQGVGLDVVPGVALRHTRDNERDRVFDELVPSGDVFYKFTPSLTGSLTVNTDFSDAPPDRREVNLTRFSLFFPEQRDFFLQDSGLFSFGGLDVSGFPFFTLGQTLNGKPFFSRRIGLSEEGPIDLRAGGKVTGRIGRLNLGLLSTRLAHFEDIDAKWLSVGRLSLNLLEESSIGLIGTYGNPLENEDNHLAGADFNYRTSEAFGDQVVEAKLWVEQSSSPHVDDREAAIGAVLGYPNDKWSGKLAFLEIQENFDPALGFANRTNIRNYVAHGRYRIRPEGSYLRTIDFGIGTDVVTNVENQVETSLLMIPVALNNQIGDHLRLEAKFWREVLDEDFEISEGVIIPPGDYRFDRIRLRFDSALARPIEAGFDVQYGEFYGGRRTDVEVWLRWKPNPSAFLGIEFEQNAVRLPQGNFTTRIARLSANLTFSSRVTWTNLIQWDSVSDLISWNSRLRWIVEPGRELIFLIEPEFLEEDDLHLTATRSRAVAKVFWTFRY
jgi:hypothetical protein